ncbi:MAG: histidine kinase [Rikenellaceae bacterium]
MWSESIVIGFAFLVNRFLLMPYLFLTKKYFQFVAALFIFFTLLGLFVLHFDGVDFIRSLFKPETSEFGMPPMGGGDGHYTRLPPQAMPPHAIPPLENAIPPAFTVMIYSMVVIALDMGLSIAFRWIATEQKQTQNDRERVAAQLENLQSQVSPHFFMNTLNNIHALVDINSGRAKQAIIELSSLMDYLLYECSNRETVALRRELDFISSYINLMRLRFPKEVKVYFSCSEKIPIVNIPPLLFLNFIENAFKYGVDYEQDSYVKIQFDFTETHINVSVINSNHSESVKRVRHGLGIDNSRKRLELIYEDHYMLDIKELKDIYIVNIKIPLQL